MIPLNLSEYRVVTPTKNAMFSASELKISKTTIRFNNLTAAEMGYPPYVRLLINMDCDNLIIQACEEKEAAALPFMIGKTAEDLTGQKKWISICNRMLTTAIRSKMGWNDNEVKRIIGVPWREQGAIIFNLKNVMAAKCRTPVLSADEILMTYRSAERNNYMPVPMSPLKGKGPFGAVTPASVVEAEYRVI